MSLTYEPEAAQVLRKASIVPAILLAGYLVGLADWLFYGHAVGINFPIFLLLAAGAMHVAAPRRSSWQECAVPALFLAAALAPSIEARSVFGAGFGIGGLVLFTLLINQRLQQAFSTQIGTVVTFVCTLPARFIKDAAVMVRAHKRRPGQAWPLFSISNWVVPVLFSAVFALLFVIANPLIQEGLSRLLTTGSMPMLDVARIGFWLLVLILVWPFLRVKLPSRRRTDRAWSAEEPLASQPGRLFAEPAIFRALGMFNLLFAVQNGLDAIYIWGGASLPDGVTYSEYAHRGSYALIVTALLAAGFVLFATRPGSQAAQSKRVRLLVLAWTAQNVILVQYCVLRLNLYVEAYSLTYFRFAAFVWMGVVFIGLVPHRRQGGLNLARVPRPIERLRKAPKKLSACQEAFSNDTQRISVMINLRY